MRACIRVVWYACADVVPHANYTCYTACFLYCMFAILFVCSSRDGPVCTIAYLSTIPKTFESDDVADIEVANMSA